MSSKRSSQFICQQCGATYTKWSGKCDNCSAWNSMVESIIPTEKRALVDRVKGKRLAIEKINDVRIDLLADRLKTGYRQVDDVLGDGLMPGGVVLLAGQPGIGKSTLLLQIVLSIGKNVPVLYISGEESAGQVRLRAERLSSKLPENVSLSATTSADDISAEIDSGDYKVVIVDSMQTIAMAEIASAPGTVSQITNSANVIIRSAKATNTAVVLVGHVTKEGSIAGPKVLEHIVDVVLSFDGDKYGGFKMLRASKNRYGSTHEVAILEMAGEGLVEVEDASASLLAERGKSDGSVVLAVMEGSRPLLVEIQALVNSSHFGYPKRTAVGFDLNRLTLLIAVLEKRTKLDLSDKDVFINVVGGLKLSDPAADLAVIMAIASASAERKLADDVVVFGEVGLGGEVRRVSHVTQRIAEAKKLGFKRALGPEHKDNKNFVIPITDLRSGLNTYLSKK